MEAEQRSWRSKAWALIARAVAEPPRICAACQQAFAPRAASSRTSCGARACGAAVVEASGCELLQPGDRQGGGVGLSRRIAPKEPDAPSWHGSTELPKVVSALSRAAASSSAPRTLQTAGMRVLHHYHTDAASLAADLARYNLAPLVLKGQVRAALKKCTPPEELSDDDDDDDDAELTEEAALAAPAAAEAPGSSSEPPVDDDDGDDDGDDDDGEAALARMAAACRATMN